VKAHCRRDASQGSEAYRLSPSCRRHRAVVWFFGASVALLHKDSIPMAKKIPAPSKATADHSKCLIDAIATVKQLQDFVQEHGTAEKALAAATRVHGLIKMTGGFDQLKQALEIVGQQSAAPQV
jgi:hypothetical protein